jgi:hypothetical protein
LKGKIFSNFPDFSLFLKSILDIVGATGVREREITADLCDTEEVFGVNLVYNLSISCGDAFGSGSYLYFALIEAIPSLELY